MTREANTGRNNWRLVNDDGVGSGEGGARGEGVDPVAVTEVAFVACAVAAAVPWFDADERCVLEWR